MNKRFFLVPAIALTLVAAGAALVGGPRANEIVANAAVDSGVPVGATLAAFHPTHVSGPDADTDTCPVCKYGALPAVQVWVGEDDQNNVAMIAKKLDGVLAQHGLRKVRAFVIYNGAPEAKVKEQAMKLGLQNVAITWLPKGNEAAGMYKINPAAKNTIFVYSDRRVAEKFVDFKASDANLMKLTAAIEKVVQ